VQKGGEDCRLLMPKPRCDQVSQLVELIEIELVIATDIITNSPWEWYHQDPFWLPDIVVGIKKEKNVG
jgi:hypothetical protein